MSYVRIRATFRVVLGLLIACVPIGAIAAPATFTVNSPADVPDNSPGDGVCRTAPDNTVCTLRAAVMEANAHPGPDTINLQANVTYLLTRAGVDDSGLNGDLDILDSVTIAGAGPASTIIEGNGVVTGDRVMQIVKCIGNASPMNGSCPGASDVVVGISGVAFRHGLTAGGLIGGGISSGGMLTLDNCAITDNRVDALGSRGGGISSFGTLTLSNSTVSNNTLGIQNFGGAGISSEGPLTIVNSTVSENVGAATPGYGGGVLVYFGTATITGSTIRGNVGAEGGGISVRNSMVNLINTTISGNSSEGGGGGLAVSSGTVGLYNVTITGNVANADAVGTATGGGVYDDGTGVTLANSILSNNSHRVEGSDFSVLDECSGALTSQGNNIVTFVVAAHCTVGLLDTDSDAGASLGPLQNNGGPTLTHALLVGSAAIDKGNSGGCTDNIGAILTTDQRGVHRPYGALCDIGAFEYADIIFQNGFDP